MSDLLKQPEAVGLFKYERPFLYQQTLKGQVSSSNYGDGVICS